MLDNSRRVIYEDKLYPCQKCGQDKIKRKLGSGSVPRYCKECKRVTRTERKNDISTIPKTDQEFDDHNVKISVVSPDGFTIILYGSEEERFYKNRLTQYQKDFEFTSSADFGILSRVIQLELAINRVTNQLGNGYNVEKSKVLVNLTEEYRKCQQDLGVARSKRMSSSKQEDVGVLITEMLDRFKIFRENNKEKFKWICSKCGEEHYLFIRNPEKEDKINEQPKPIEGS